MDGIESGDFIWIDFGIMDCGPPIPFARKWFVLGELKIW
jgi:hypothetical protein